MKRFLMCFAVFLTTTVCMANEYREAVKKCDKVAETEQETAISNIQMVQIVEKQKNCYKNVVNKIIEAEYAQNKQQMESEFDNFIKNSSDVAYSMQYPDNCTPDCGTIVGLNAANATLKLVKTYVQQLLYAVSEKH